MIDIKKHYPYVTRSLLRLFNDGKLTNVSSVNVEPDYGYVARINYIDGTFRITYGNDLGLNTSASGSLAKDKGFTKFMLRNIGVTCPDGQEFLMPWWEEIIRPTQEKKNNFNLRTCNKAYEYINNYIKYPVYVKPIQGSKGANVFKVDNDDELSEIFTIYEDKKVTVAVIEKTIYMPDYRIVVLDGELVSAYKRIPLFIVGDGIHDIEFLVNQLQDKYTRDGRDTRLSANEPGTVKYLAKLGLNIKNIPNKYEKITLTAISNLSAGGTSVDVSEFIATRWVELAAYIAKSFDLRLCGVDLACQDISSSESEYCVIEVNASPGLDHYASSGDEQKKIVDGLYTKAFNKS